MFLLNLLSALLFCALSAYKPLAHWFEIKHKCHFSELSDISTTVVFGIEINGCIII